jgi:RNA polymerase sigma-70 factor (ECF subfamily)
MPQKLSEPDTDSLLQTRQSLLSRLRDWQDQAGWREFFDTYWRLIYSVARRSGLSDAQAQDVVQNTFIYLARRMPGFHYDRARGSFKSWLRVVTRSRVQAFWRAQKPDEKFIHEPRLDAAGDEVEPQCDGASDELDEVWQREWEENLMSTALRRVRAKVRSQQLLIFRLSALGEMSPVQVARKLGVNIAQVYLARHRVGKLLKAEVLRLRQETE